LNLAMPKIASTAWPVEIFDVTIRDGSYAIDFQFTPHDIRFLCATLERLGFRYIEIGHGLGLNAPAVKGGSAASDEDYLRAAVASLQQARFGAFFIPGIGRKEDLLRARRDFGMNFIRIGDDPEKIDRTALEYLEYARELGYEVMANFMKSYALPPTELARKAKVLADHGAEAVYLVDSAGGMLPDEVAAYVQAIAGECGARIGFHGHNNLELAGANAIAAYRHGCTLIDCSIGGLGRSAGNTRTEMMIPILQWLGVPLPYDLLGVLQALEQVIRPLLSRRALTPKHLLSGFARVHSGLMSPFHELARRYDISVETLLYAYGSALAHGLPQEPLEQTAARLAAQAPPRPNVSPSANALLQVDARWTDRERITNTFGAVDDIVNAVSTLAQKANLPIAALVTINAVPVDEPYLMADYLYHDEQFVVMRILFSHVEQFTEVLHKHRGRFAVLVFEEPAKEVRARLAATEGEWRHGEAVVYSSRTLRNYHALFAALYQCAMETSAERVLFFGGQPEEIARHLPPGLADLHYFCAGRAFGLSEPTGLVRLDPGTGQVQRNGGTGPFQIAVLLSPSDRAEVEALLERLAPDGVIIDCVRQASALPDLVQAAGKRLVTLDLYRALSAELTSLLEVSKRPAPLPVTSGARSPASERPRSWHEINADQAARAPDAACCQGARALVETCADVRAGEKVYVLADESTQAVADYVYLAAAQRGAVLAYDLVAAGWMHGAEPSAAIAERMLWADVVFCLTPTSMAHTRARKRAADRGTRFLSLPDYSLGLLASPSLQVDFAALKPLARRLSRLLDHGREVRILTDGGTDLRFSIVGRLANCCPGVCRDPGVLGSPPDAEVNIAPLEGAAQGMIWVDGSIPCRSLGRLREPIGLRIADGSIVAIEGPPREVRLLEELFEAVRAPEARVLAEFGIGLNPQAEITGRMLEDEGCAGTAHFGFGNNATIGGKTSVPFHLDFVLRAPFVWLDGVALLRAGSLVERRAAA
jgi:4-hydroxy 2-oxovalerate aldolase/long-chain acyl-CoA synthetase